MASLKRCLFIVLFITSKGDNCSKYCRPSPSGKVFCLTSGECAEGCNPGFFGKTCNEKCSQHCQGDICAFDDGRCTKGCKKNFCGHRCIRMCYSVVSTSTLSTKKYTKMKTSTVPTKIQSSVFDVTIFAEKTESKKEGTSLKVLPKIPTTVLLSTGTYWESTPADKEGETPVQRKILIYSGIGVVVLVANAAIISFLYVCVRRILYRTNSRIEATHASVRVIELACIPQRPSEVPDVGQPTASTSYLTARHDSSEKERVVSTHEYEAIDSKDLEPVMLLAECFDDFVEESKSVCSVSDYSGGKYLLSVTRQQY